MKACIRRTSSLFLRVSFQVRYGSLSLLVLLAGGLDSLAGQDPATPGAMTTSRSAFLKNLTIESFGIGRDPQPGLEFIPGFPNGTFATHGLECPRCFLEGPAGRRRYTLPAFGAEATLKLWHDRSELFSGFGGINAYRSDSSPIEPGIGSFRRDSSFNDAWLLQRWSGARIAIDPAKRIWFNITDRSVRSLAPAGLKRWNTVSAGATILFGR